MEDNRNRISTSAGGRRIKHKKKPSRKFALIRSAVILVIIIVAVAFGVSRCRSGKDTVTTGHTQQEETAQPKAKEYNVPPASEENDLLKIARNAQGTAGEKVCYLTFDDGPTKEVTPKVLEVLKKYNVKATFFCLGKMLEANRDIAKQEVSEGHLLANHSYSHEYKQLYATSESFMGEIDKTESLIADICGEEPFKLIRFPGGSYNAGDHAAEKQVYKGKLKENGYYYVDWNCLNGDAESALKSVDSLVSKVKATATEDNIVILMHDAAAKTTTPQALGQIIEYLKSKGYTFKRLDEIEYYDTGEETTDANTMIL